VGIFPKKNPDTNGIFQNTPDTRDIIQKNPPYSEFETLFLKIPI